MNEAPACSAASGTRDAVTTMVSTGSLDGWLAGSLDSSSDSSGDCERAGAAASETSSAQIHGKRVRALTACRAALTRKYLLGGNASRPPRGRGRPLSRARPESKCCLKAWDSHPRAPRLQAMANLPFHNCPRQERLLGRREFPYAARARRAANVVHSDRSPGFRADSSSPGTHAARLPALGQWLPSRA